MELQAEGRLSPELYVSNHCSGDRCWIRQKSGVTAINGSCYGQSNISAWIMTGIDWLRTASATRPNWMSMMMWRGFLLWLLYGHLCIFGHFLYCSIWPLCEVYTARNVIANLTSLSVCLLYDSISRKIRIHILYQIFACWWWPWLGLSLLMLWYVMHLLLKSHWNTYHRISRSIFWPSYSVKWVITCWRICAVLPVLHTYRIKSHQMRS